MGDESLVSYVLCCDHAGVSQKLRIYHSSFYQCTGLQSKHLPDNTLLLLMQLFIYTERPQESCSIQRYLNCNSIFSFCMWWRVRECALSSVHMCSQVQCAFLSHSLPCFLYYCGRWMERGTMTCLQRSEDNSRNASHFPPCGGRLSLVSTCQLLENFQAIPLPLPPISPQQCWE